jgi:sarcosine oxidase
MKTEFNTIVIGLGGIGAAAAYWLSRRIGGDVLGLEQFNLFHVRGASQDYSRIIRLAYHDDKYIRLTPFTYKAWAEVEDESGVKIVTKTGGVQIADMNSEFHAAIEAYARAMDRAGVAYERLRTDELRYRFSGIEPKWDVEALYQSETGICDPSKGNAAHIALARGRGATLIDMCAVSAITPTADGGAQVQTAQGTFGARRVVVTADAWTNNLIAPLLGRELPLQVTQEQATYYATPHLKEHSVGRFPVFQWKHGQSYYGFPVHGEVATKAAIDASGHVVTADSRTFDPNPEREKQLTDFLAARMPRFVGKTLYTKTCLYTMPPDRHFILDALPEHPQISLFIGAGHGYKFASLVGQILAGLALDGGTPHDISPFKVDREALVNPGAAVYGYV